MVVAEDADCPRCGTYGALRIDHALFADPLGSHSLAGSTMKTNARMRPVLTCRQCPLRLIGEYQGRHAVFDNPDGN